MKKQFDYMRRPTRAELLARLDEVRDRRWYARSCMLRDTDPKGKVRLGAKERQRCERQYGKDNLGPYSDMEWGELHGWQLALTWILEGYANGDT